MKMDQLINLLFIDPDNYREGKGHETKQTAGNFFMPCG